MANLKINKYLTPYNHNSGDINRIQYIVIHYVGALGSAKANCQWYAGGDRGASAHYFVDFDGSIWQSVEDKDIAWHCGAKVYKHPECRNANSIGIEMCVRNKGSQADTSRDWYFKDATIQAAISLTKDLMEKYNIPADRVIRHYDITGKICPNPFVYNQGKLTWQDFKSALSHMEKKSGWYLEENNWHFYLGDTGSCVKNNWYKDETGHWAWFDGDGNAIHDTWYEQDHIWYYFGSDCYMVAGRWIEYKGNQYYLAEDGSMATSVYIKSKDPACNLYYWVDDAGKWRSEWNTVIPDLTKYKVVV